MREFVALIYQGPEGDYRVSFPDFPTITAAGETLERARAKAEVALFSHIRRLVAEGQIIPGPLSLEAIMADPRHQGALDTMIVELLEIDNSDER
jgi:predicted RNase H-like HicB family nuclease